MKITAIRLAPRLAALAALLAGAASLVPGSALAAGGHGFSGGGRSAGPGSHGHPGAGWHGGRPGAGWQGRGWHGGGWRGGYWGHRGYVRPGVFWGGVGLGLGLGAMGYYGGWWGPYGYPTAPVYETYIYGAVPPVLVAPATTFVDPASVAGQPVPLAARAPDPIFYPVKGQSAATTEDDRRDCNRWATTQSGAMADASIFQRATFACMEGRGYTVR